MWAVTYLDLDHIPQPINNKQVGVALGTFAKDGNVARMQPTVPEGGGAAFVIPVVPVRLVRRRQKQLARFTKGLDLAAILAHKAGLI